MSTTTAVVGSIESTVRRRSARGFLFLYVGLVIAGGLLLLVGLGLSVGLVVGVPVVVLLAYLPFSLGVRALLQGKRSIATAWCLLSVPIPYLWMAGVSLGTNSDGGPVTISVTIAYVLYLLASGVAFLPFPLYIWLALRRLYRPS